MLPERTLSDNNNIETRMNFFLKPLCFLIATFLSGFVNAQVPIQMEPFVIDHRNAAGSTVDLSFLHEKPAGKSGFVTIKNGHFYKPDGKRLKLWGVNVTQWTRSAVQLPTKEESVFWAKTLARYGVNCVRLHFLDFPHSRGGVIDGRRTDTRHLDSLQMDKLDFWIAELKKNGIYSDLNLLVGRTFKEGDNLKDYDQVGWAKYVSYFSPRLIELQKEYAKNLLMHYNPYTKTEYRNEPAIVILELVNENTLFDAWERDALHPLDKPNRDPNFKAISAHYSDMLTQQFNDYLKKTKSPQQLAQIRHQAGVKDGELVPRIRKAAYQTSPKELFNTTVQFYMETERNFFKDMRRYLKDTLKINQLLLGSNDFLHNQPEYPMIWSNAAMDIQDGHVYWQHPSWPGKLNTPMVNEPDSSTVVKLSRTAVAGMPYTVTEVNHSSPNDYESEGIPVLAAYASLQDWDAVIWYTFEPKSTPDFKGYIPDAFDISHHPVKMPQFAAAALMFLRGDVKAGKEVIKRNYTTEQIRETMRMPQSEAAYYTPGFPVANVLKHQVRIGSMEGPATQRFKPVKENPVVSDTKELAWYTENQKNGLVTVETPRSQALVGFVKANGKSVKNLSANVSNDFCSLTLSSLDDKPIESSSHLLLVAAARAENTGLQWNATRTKSTRSAGAPSVIETVKGTITLKGLKNVSSLTAQPLDGSGKALGTAVSAKKTPAGWIIPIGNAATTWYELNVIR